MESIGVIQKVKEILLTEKEMVFLVFLYFHEKTKLSKVVDCIMK